VHWDFGDGTHADTGEMTRFVHAFRPGRYTVRLSARSQSGDTASWELSVQAYPRLQPKISARRTGRRVRLTASALGGSGEVLAWRWRFRGGGDASGQRVRHVFRRGLRPQATLTVADTAGCSTESATYRARAAASRPHRRHARRHRARRRPRQPRFTG
jgi:PKD repeat protein